MIDLLENYLAVPEDTLLERINKLQSNSDIIDRQLVIITEILNSITVPELQLQKNPSSSLQVKQRILKKYFAKSQKHLITELEYLVRQQAYLQVMVQFYKKYVEVDKTNPRIIQQKIGELKEIIGIALQLKQQYMMETQDDLGSGMQTKIVQILQNYHQKLKKCLKEHIKSLVKVQPNKKFIKVDFLQISQNQALIDQNILTHYVDQMFQQLFSYQVNSKNYIILSPSIQQNNQPSNSQKLNQKQGILMIQRIPIIFTKEDSQQFFDQIVHAVKQNLKVFNLLLNSIGSLSLRSWLIEQKDRNLTKVRNLLDYINPYLSLKNRRQLLLCLQTSEQLKTSKILIEENQEQILDAKFAENIKTSDLLVKLKLKGQDGDMLSSTVNILTRKLIEPDAQNDRQMLIRYLQMIENSKSSVLNLGLFISNQLIQNIQTIDSQQKVSYQYIKRLIRCRQNIRSRIHHPTD